MQLHHSPCPLLSLPIRPLSEASLLWKVKPVWCQVFEGKESVVDIPLENSPDFCARGTHPPLLLSVPSHLSPPFLSFSPPLSSSSPSLLPTLLLFHFFFF